MNDRPVLMSQQDLADIDAHAEEMGRRIKTLERRTETLEKLADAAVAYRQELWRISDHGGLDSDGDAAVKRLDAIYSERLDAYVDEEAA